MPNHPPRTCENDRCNASFTPTWHLQRFCTRRCKELMRNRRLRPETMQDPIECRGCGVRFVRDCRSQKFCTKDCQKATQRRVPEGVDTSDWGSQTPESRSKVDETLRHVLTLELMQTLLHGLRSREVA